MLNEHLVTFVHISDTHLHHDATYTGRFTDILPRPGVEMMLKTINELTFPVDFVLHTGDVMTDPTGDAEYAVAREVFSHLRHPIHYLAGNHDRAGSIQRVLMQRTTVTPHLDYEFETNGVQFVCLDSSVPDPDIHYGQLEDSQLAWLERLCTADDPRPLVVAVHHHALPLEAPWLDSIVLQNGEALHQTLLKARHRLRGVFFGHIHESTITTRDGISYYSALSGWFQTRTWYRQEQPNNEPLYYPGFNVVTLTTKDTFVRHYRVKMP